MIDVAGIDITNTIYTLDKERGFTIIAPALCPRCRAGVTFKTSDKKGHMPCLCGEWEIKVTATRTKT